MPSVSPEIYRSVSLVARYIFAVLALMVLLRTLLQMLSDAGVIVTASNYESTKLASALMAALENR